MIGEALYIPRHEHEIDAAFQICRVCGLASEGIARGNPFDLRLDLLRRLRELGR